MPSYESCFWIRSWIFWSIFRQTYMQDVVTKTVLRVCLGELHVAGGLVCWRRFLCAVCVRPASATADGLCPPLAPGDRSLLPARPSSSSSRPCARAGIAARRARSRACMCPGVARHTRQTRCLSPVCWSCSRPCARADCRQSPVTRAKRGACPASGVRGTSRRRKTACPSSSGGDVKE